MIHFNTSLMGVLGILLLSSCSQEEFYAKEYLTPYNQTLETSKEYPRIVDASSSTFTDPSTGTSAEPSTGTTTNPSTGTSTEPSTGTTTNPSTGTSTEPTTGTGTATVTLASEHFTQSARDSKIDILWVIDNSGSMADDQDSLARNFDSFIQEFIQKNIDFQMAITTTDARSTFNGREICGIDKLSLVNAQMNLAQFYSDFSNCVKVGDQGSGVEKGLNGMSEYLRLNATHFLRPDAYLAVVVLSDENDQSSLSVSEYVNNLKTYKAQVGLLKYYGIISTNLIGVTSSESIGTRYQEMRDLLGGTIAEIKEDFYSTLSNMGQSMLNLVKSFSLSHTPVGSIIVKVNGVMQTEGWSYDAQTRSILFDETHVPQDGADVSIEYYWESV